MALDRIRFATTFVGSFLSRAVLLGALGPALASCSNGETQAATPHNQLVAAQACRTCAVVEGKVACWGQLDPKPATPAMPTRIALPGPAIAIGTSGSHTCVTLADSTGVYCWGANESGQLGVPPSMTNPTDPVKAPVKSAFSASAKAYVMGDGFTCALDATGAVKCAGGRIVATLGNGPDAKPIDTPIAVPSLATITAIAGGLHHACALDKDGVVACWGQNNAGQCGQKDGSVDFAAHVAIPPADKIWGGEEYTCAHLTTGEIDCWGNNSNGQWGTTMIQGSDTPQKVPLDAYKDLSLGGARACGVDAQGNVDCWGLELAMKPMKAITPTRVDTIAAPNAFVSGTANHCAWAGGILYCWGQNDCGQVGVAGTLQTGPVPVTLPP